MGITGQSRVTLMNAAAVPGSRMRVFITLESLKDYAYDREYYHKLQGFAYGLLRHTPYAYLHDAADRRIPFCFSNIFPIKESCAGARKHLILSSPHPGLVEAFHTALAGMDEMHIGEMSFRIRDVKTLRPQLRRGMKLITATPILLRIPDYNYERYGIESERPYEYWRPQYPFEVFVKQLEENLYKKYKSVLGEDIDEVPLFDQFAFKGMTTVNLVFNGRTFHMPATYWEFPITHMTKKRRALLRFALDAGLGERNSFGLGFVNTVAG